MQMHFQHVYIEIISPQKSFDCFKNKNIRNTKNSQYCIANDIITVKLNFPNFIEIKKKTIKSRFTEHLVKNFFSISRKFSLKVQKKLKLKLK